MPQIGIAKITTESVLYFHKDRLSQAQSEINFVDDVARGNLTLYRENSRPVVQTPPEEKNNAYFSVRLSESKIGVSNLSNVVRMAPNITLSISS